MYNIFLLPFIISEKYTIGAKIPPPKLFYSCILTDQSVHIVVEPVVLFSVNRNKVSVNFFARDIAETNTVHDIDNALLLLSLFFQLVLDFLDLAIRRILYLDCDASRFVFLLILF